MRRLLFGFGLFVAAAGFAAELEIEIRDGHTNALYAVGEEATFSLSVKKGLPAGQSTNVVVTMDAFGGEALQKRDWDPLKEPVLTLKGALDKPGFLRVQAVTKKADTWSIGKGNACWAVGYEPSKLRGSTPRPADFETYWRGELARLERDVPADFRREWMPTHATKGFGVWKVSAATFDGRRNWGWLVVPTNAVGRVPLLVRVKGAGAAYCENAVEEVKKGGEATLLLNVHYYEPCATEKEQNAKYDELNAACRKRYGCSINYSRAGAGEGREVFYFHDAIVGLSRLVKIVTGLPFVDSERVWYYASSQGTGVGIAVVALNPAFRRAFFLVPALSDLCGFRQGHQSGWPLLVENQPTDVAKKTAEETARYYDAVNFAPMVTIPVRVTVGFADNCCPPYGGYALFNNLASKDKAIRNGLGMWHSTYPEIIRDFHAWLRSGK